MNDKEMKDNINNYAKLAYEVGDMIIMNNITELDEFYYENITNGELFYCITHDDDDECEKNEHMDCDMSGADEVYQWFAISERGENFLSKYTNELIMYNEQLDTYFWGICHYGTSWTHVAFDGWK